MKIQVKNENVHLTLAFFGEISSERIETIIKVMNDLSCGGAFSINFSEAGVFEKRGGDIWWIGIEKSEELLRLQNSLTEAFIKEEVFTYTEIYGTFLKRRNTGFALDASGGEVD